MRIRLIHICRPVFSDVDDSDIGAAVKKQLSYIGKTASEFSLVESGFAEIDELLYLPDSQYSDPESIRRFDAVDLFIFVGSRPLDDPWSPELASVSLLMTQCVQFSRGMVAFGSAYTQLVIVLATGGQFFEWNVAPISSGRASVEHAAIEPSNGNVHFYGRKSANVGACRWDFQNSIHKVDGPSFNDTILQHGSFEIMHNVMPTDRLMQQIPPESLFKNACRWTSLASVVAPRIPTFKVLCRSNKTGIVAFKAGRVCAAQFCPSQRGAASEKQFLRNVLDVTCKQLSHLAGLGVSSKNLLLAQSTLLHQKDAELKSVILPAPVTLQNAAAQVLHSREDEFTGQRLAQSNTISEARQDSRRKHGGGYIDAAAQDLASAACISRATSDAEVLVFPAFAFSSVSMQQHPLLRSLQFPQRSPNAQKSREASAVDLSVDEEEAERLSRSAHRARRAAEGLAASAGKHISMKARKNQRGADKQPAAEMALHEGGSDVISSLDRPASTRRLPTSLATAAGFSPHSSAWLQTANAIATERLRTKALKRVQRRPSVGIDADRVQKQNFFRAKQTATIDEGGQHKRIGDVGRGYELGSTVEPSSVLAMVRPAVRDGCASLQRVSSVGKLGGYGNANGAFDDDAGLVLSMATDASYTAECFARHHDLAAAVFYGAGADAGNTGQPSSANSQGAGPMNRSKILQPGPSSNQSAISHNQSPKHRLYSCLQDAFSSTAPLRSLQAQSSQPGRRTAGDSVVFSPVATKRQQRLNRQEMQSFAFAPTQDSSSIEYHFRADEDTPFTQSVRSLPEPAKTADSTKSVEQAGDTPCQPASTAHTVSPVPKPRPAKFGAYFRSSSFSATDAHSGGGLQFDRYKNPQQVFRDEQRDNWRESTNSKAGFLFGATHTRSRRAGRISTGYKLGDEFRTYDPGNTAHLVVQ